MGTPPRDEAPTGLNTQSNGFVGHVTMDEAIADFEKVETPEDGAGPVFNKRHEEWL